MPIGEVCSRDVVFAERALPLREAAKLMRRYHIGDLIVVERRDGALLPIGIVTDRDIVIEVIAKDINLDELAVGDLMSRELITVREQDGIYETIQLMRASSIRRVPIVNSDGMLIGIVSMDDLLEMIAEEMTELTRIPAREREIEASSRP